MPAPRSFAGNKSVSVARFAQSFANSLGNSEKFRKLAATVAALCIEGLPGGSPCVTDLGGLMKMQRPTFADILHCAGADENWLTLWEDILEFSFPVPALPASVPLSAKLVKAEKGGLRTPLYEEVKEKLGSRLVSEGTLDGFVFTRADFPNVSVSNPLLEVLTNKDVSYIMDQVWLKTMAMFGVPSMDKIMRTHVGRQLRILFPLLPDRGKGKTITLGADRSFVDMLRWRFSNPRKTTSQVHDSHHISVHACMPLRSHVFSQRLASPRYRITTTSPPFPCSAWTAAPRPSYCLRIPSSRCR